MIGRLSLDRRLAEGEDPGCSPKLARRAQELIRRRNRRSLSEGLVRVVGDASRAPRVRRGATIPVQREAVLEARRDLLRLAAALRDEPAPDVRAIAEASVLVTDGGGPVFVPHPEGTLRRAALRAASRAESHRVRADHAEAG